MIEIIPNWLPIFVQFTVALITLTVGFHIICHFPLEGNLKQHFELNEKRVQIKETTVVLRCDYSEKSHLITLISLFQILCIAIYVKI